MTLADSPLPAQPATSLKRDTQAVIGLLLATVMWGCGFTWAKAAGAAVNQAVGLGHGGALGPIFILAWRFVLAGLAVFILIPAARRGWTARGILRIFGVGLLLSASIVVQHLGLDRTSEAVSAFLTNLTVVCIPIIVLITTGKQPSLIVWSGIALAVVGIWLLTGSEPPIANPQGTPHPGFGLGELLGIACAVGFSIYILVVNAVSKTEDPWRMTAGQFLATGLICTIVSALVPRGAAALAPHTLIEIVSAPDVWRNVLLLTVFTTIGAFTLLNFFQPRIDPTRAALIYLIEPICAALYAFIAIGRPMTPRALAGAALILIANIVVEVIATRSRRRSSALENPRREQIDPI